MISQISRGRANIINIIRFDHGLATVEAQMQEIRRRNLPATWLLQYDALAAGPYVEFLRAHAAPDHEIGLWLEINRRQCQDAGVRYKGEMPEPGDTLDTANWDHHFQALLSISYAADDRVKLIDTMMRKYSSLFGHFPMSVASCYIGAFSLNYLADKYHVTASANCADQWQPDGFCLWGAPSHAFYYPSRTHAAMAANSDDIQIPVPVFRLWGADPVNGKTLLSEKTGGRSPSLRASCPGCGADPEWVRRYLDTMLDQSTRPFPYVQVGEENVTRWEDIGDSYCFQLDELIRRRDRGELIVETLGQSGQYVREFYPHTPIGVLNVRSNPIGEGARAVWFHSRHYRAQVIYSNRRFEIVDLYRYSDDQIEPFHRLPVTTWCLAVTAAPMVDRFLFGSHWYLEGHTADGRRFDERHTPIHDVHVAWQEADEPDTPEALVITYHNGAGIHSRLTFTAESIRIERQFKAKASFQEVLAFDPQARWTCIQGTWRNQIIFAWNNYDYRAELREELPAYEADKGRIVLHSAANASECTTTLFVFPCVVNCPSALPAP